MLSAAARSEWELLHRVQQLSYARTEAFCISEQAAG